MNAPLILDDIAEPRLRGASLAFRIRRGVRKVWHSLLPRKMERVVVRGGIRYMLNGYEPVCRWLLKQGHWEPDAVVRFFNLARERGAEVFLDLGANFGYYSLLAARLGIFDKIHAFEPHPQTYRRLLWHIRANNFEGVITPHNVAASDSACEMQMWVMDKNNSGSALIVDNHKGGDAVAVSAAPLDSLFAFRGRKIAVKMDVEKHELAAVAGMEKLLANNNVIAQIEILETDSLLKLLARGLLLTDRLGDDFYFVNAKRER